ncbi:MAG: hypothetical protein ACRETA_04515 [Gammaproteobacteria bacterium]
MKLSGAPDMYLTGGLLILAVVAVIIAFKAPPLVKATALTWIVMP